MTDDKKKNLPAKSDPEGASRQERHRTGFLDKVRSSKAISATSKQETLSKALTHDERPRLLFSMDATASREAAWNVAKEITEAMFIAVPDTLDFALAYHGGGHLQELTPFSPDAKAFLDKVHTVQCKAGVTALNDILDRASDISKLKALIYIGDCFEENASEAVELAQQLKLKGVRCFIFHDTSSGSQGYDVDTAHKVFQQIAQIAGGDRRLRIPWDKSPRTEDQAPTSHPSASRADAGMNRNEWKNAKVN